MQDKLNKLLKSYALLKVLQKADNAINPSVSANNSDHPWRLPTTEEIHENVNDWPDFFSIMSKEENLPAFTDKDIEKLIRIYGKVIEVPHDQILTTLKNNDPLSRQDVLSGKDGYKPSSDRITQAFQNGTPLPMPIAFRFPSGSHAVLSGRHRLGHAADNKKNLKIISVPYGIHPDSVKDSASDMQIEPRYSKIKKGQMIIKIKKDNWRQKSPEILGDVLYKSEIKRYLDNKGFFKSATAPVVKTWQDSYRDRLIKKQPTQLIHYSSQPGLKILDPKKMGTGIGGDFNRRFNPSKIKDFPHTTFAYVNDMPEDIVKQASNSKYILKLHPDHQLYDMGEDKDGLVKQTVAANNGAWDYEQVLRNIKAAGYHGVWAPKSEHPVIKNTVMLFHPQEVHKEVGVHEPIDQV